MSVTSKNSLREKIEDRSAIIAVVGLGYVGLPFAVEKAKVGFKFVGIEMNPARANRVNKGENYIADVADDELKMLVQQGSLRAVTTFEEAKQADVFVICVPTPLTKNMTPELSYVEGVTHSIAKVLRAGQLVTLESTTYPGTTDEIIRPVFEGTELVQGQDFFLAHSPERVDPGNQRYTTKNTNKVVGASDSDSLEVATLFYQQTIDHVVPVISVKAAVLHSDENSFDPGNADGLNSNKTIKTPMVA